MLKVDRDRNLCMNSMKILSFLKIYICVLCRHQQFIELHQITENSDSREKFMERREEKKRVYK
jgi:hypothetical protein